MHKLEIKYITDISSTCFREVREILDAVSIIYEKIDIQLDFIYIDVASLQKYITSRPLTSLYQILGLFKLDKQEYFKDYKCKTLLISQLELNSKKPAVSMNIDEDETKSIILVNYYNTLLKKEFTTKQKIYITAHEIAHSIGASHTSNRLGSKYTIMNSFVPNDNEIVLMFSGKTKKDIHEYMENYKC